MPDAMYAHLSARLDVPDICITAELSALTAVAQHQGTMTQTCLAPDTTCLLIYARWTCICHLWKKSNFICETRMQGCQ